MIVQFIPASEDVETLVTRPIPTKKCVPDWYKKIESFNPEKIEFDEKGSIKNKGVKTCMPFFDAISAGYVQTTWTDIHVEKRNNSVIVRTASGPEILQTRENVSMPVGDLFYPIEYVWKMPWLPKMPKGYSALLTHPMNRLDLPFLSLSGVVDSDAYYHTPFGNFPFYIKKGFEGVIPEGTPMYQIIPLKRDQWESRSSIFNKKEARKRINTIEKYFYGAYKHRFWTRKDYN